MQKDADNLLYQKHYLKPCSVEMPKLQVKTKAKLKDPSAWFQNLETKFQIKCQEEAMNFDEDDNEIQVSTDCNFCGYKSQSLNEHLDHIATHSSFTCNISTSPCLDEEDFANHMVEKHNCNVMDRRPWFAQDLIRGTENTVMDVLVQAGDQINEELTPFKLAVVVEDSPPKKSPAKKRSTENNSEQPVKSKAKTAIKGTLGATESQGSDEEHLKALLTEELIIQAYSKEYIHIPYSELPSLSETDRNETCMEATSESERDEGQSDTTAMSSNETIPVPKASVADCDFEHNRSGYVTIVDANEHKLSNEKNSQGKDGNRSDKHETTSANESDICKDPKSFSEEEPKCVTQCIEGKSDKESNIYGSGQIPEEDNEERTEEKSSVMESQAKELNKSGKDDSQSDDGKQSNREGMSDNQSDIYKEREVQGTSDKEWNIYSLGQLPEEDKEETTEEKSFVMESQAKEFNKSGKDDSQSDDGKQSNREGMSDKVIFARRKRKRSLSQNHLGQIVRHKMNKVMEYIRTGL